MTLVFVQLQGRTNLENLLQCTAEFVSKALKDFFNCVYNS